MRLGAWGKEMSESEMLRFIESCIDMGLNHFDHADIYGSYTTEADFGSAIAKVEGLKHKVKITSKCGIRYVSENRPEHKIKSYDLSREHIIASVENSLKALGVEQIENLLLHRPCLLMDVEEIAATFELLKSSGKVKNVGVSNFTLAQVEELHALHSLQMIQNEINPFNTSIFESGLLNFCRKSSIQVSSWSPLAGGKIFDDSHHSNAKALHTLLKSLEEKYGLEKDQLIISWLRVHPAGIIPVTGTGKIERISKLNDSRDIVIDKEDWYAILAAAQGKSVA